MVKEVTGTKTKKQKVNVPSVCLSLPWQKLLLAVLVSLVEFVDASGGVNELDFTGVERVRGVGDLDLDNRILNSVNFEGLFGLGA